MGRLERSESIAKSFGTFKMKQHTNGAVCSVAHLGPRKAGDGKGPGKEDSTRGRGQMSQARMGSPKLSAWLLAITVSYVGAQKKRLKCPCTISATPPSGPWFLQTHSSDPENTVVITVGKHVSLSCL